jgi:two-component system response regulator YesN
LEQPSTSAAGVILIVDDDRDLLYLLTEAFQNAGYYVVGASDFASARVSLRTHRLTALLTDVRLGEYNGIQLALLAREMHPAIKVVVFSGFDDPVLREEAERLGAPFLVKPVSSEILVNLLRDGQVH